MEDSGTCYKDQSTFLNAICGDFLNNIIPEQGLLDEFFEVGAISSEEEQTVKAEPTRRGKARKLWIALQRVPPRLFGEKCVPILECKYPHVILKRQFDWKDQSKSESMCLRHVIEKRMTPRRFADILPESDCSTAAEYENVIGTQGPVAWKKLFNIIKQNCHSKKLKESLLKMFHTHNMQLPKNFDLLLACGFPCTCDKGHQKESFSSQKVLVPRFEVETSSETSYPSSSLSDPDIDMSSVSSEDEYHSRLDKINKAIKDASSIKPIYRDLECIQADIISFAVSAKNEPVRKSRKGNIRDCVQKQKFRIVK
ncbi:uncharacterized protein LOC112575578 isoform X2 [Pomacea canaliculata]|uniref:uncharacterized protein LOC112575578 isoform X2 n=1 Tax=Pomacea canaliculata TaxID=400727 RepID=UPI000D729FB7|nr:uncharacterized protein LOC112575578 isoform X2 [Pomacea canaliculata]